MGDAPFKLGGASPAVVEARRGDADALPNDLVVEVHGVGLAVAGGDGVEASADAAAGGLGGDVEVLGDCLDVVAIKLEVFSGDGCLDPVVLVPYSIVLECFYA